MRKKKDNKELFLNSLSGISTVLLSSAALIVILYVITVLVRFAFSLGEL